MLLALAALAAACTVQMQSEVAAALPVLRRFGAPLLGLRVAPRPRAAPALKGVPRAAPALMGVSDRTAQDGLLYDGWGKAGMEALDRTTSFQNFATKMGVSHYVAVLMVSQRAKELEDKAREADAGYIGNSFGGALGSGPRTKKPAKSWVVLAVEDLLAEAGLEPTPEPHEGELPGTDAAPPEPETEAKVETSEVPKFLTDWVPPGTPDNVVENWQQRGVAEGERDVINWLMTRPEEETGLQRLPSMQLPIFRAPAAAATVPLDDGDVEEESLEAGEIEEEPWGEGVSDVEDTLKDDGLDVEEEPWEEGEPEVLAETEQGAGDEAVTVSQEYLAKDLAKLDVEEPLKWELEEEPWEEGEPEVFAETEQGAGDEAVAVSQEDLAKDLAKLRVPELKAQLKGVAPKKIAKGCTIVTSPGSIAHHRFVGPGR